MSALDPSQEVPKDRAIMAQPPVCPEFAAHAPTTTPPTMTPPAMRVDSQPPVPPPIEVPSGGQVASPPAAVPPPLPSDTGPADNGLVQPVPVKRASVPNERAQPAPLRKAPATVNSAGMNFAGAKPRPLPVPKAKALMPIPIGSADQISLRLGDEEDEELEEDQFSTRALLEAPPWLISLVIHMTVLIALGLFYLPQIIKQTILVEATVDENPGIQLIDPSLEDDSEIAEPELLEKSLEIIVVEDLTPQLPDVEISLDALLPANSDLSNSINLGLSARMPGNKAARLALGGGNSQTQKAVELGLEWLKRNQLKDGSWRLDGPYRNPGADPNPIAATAMALLAFQGNGHTHIPNAAHKKDYSRVVLRGAAFLLKQQDKDGNFYHRGPQHQRLYSQAQATIALCELYGMTKDSKYRHPAQLAIDYAAKIQSREGGWRYAPGRESDMSVTGWFVMALQSGLMAELEVPKETLYRVSEYLDTVSYNGAGRYSYEKGSRYVYQPGRPPTPAMTAEGLLCRQYLGWKRDHPSLLSGVAYLNANPIRWREKNVYYWYYATQVTHHMGGEPWSQWNTVMKKVLPSNQVKAGKEAGSWDPKGDEWGTYAGRLYTTCLCIYMLEVYYRHLPIYSHNID